MKIENVQEDNVNNVCNHILKSMEGINDANLLEGIFGLALAFEKSLAYLKASLNFNDKSIEIVRNTFKEIKNEG